VQTLRDAREGSHTRRPAPHRPAPHPPKPDGEELQAPATSIAQIGPNPWAPANVLPIRPKLEERALVVSLPNREIALKDVDQQRRKIAQQRELIGQLAANGQPTDPAEEMLRTMEHTLSIMELELRRFPAVR